ncbi:TfoX/Sxy family protein [Roseateles sp.]|uniref:TfoX/Sxy family protein n=1 Tax=Roseateles sp. TaxID=1971397 RepID=UPI0032653520
MDAFTDLCVELLSPLGPARTRRMFGGQGIYIDGLFVALVFGSQLFLKVDNTTRERFVAAGCSPFTYPNKDGERIVVSYYGPPEEALESPPLMLPWARLALEAALRAANAKTMPKPKKSTATAKRAARSAGEESAAVAKRAAKKIPGGSAAKKPAAKKTAARRG